MKTSTYFNMAKSVLFVIVFFWASLSANAQCPTVNDPNPPPICDASGFKFSDLNSFATDNGNGIRWYNASTGGSSFSDTELVQEGTYYADDDSGSCGARESLTITFQINISVSNADGIYCSNENPTVQTYIDEVFQSFIPSGGSIEVYNDLALSSLASPSESIPSGGKNYFIVFYDGANGTGCSSQIIIGPTFLINASPDPTPINPQAFCSDTNPTIADLDPGTSETNYNWYSSVDGDGNPNSSVLPLSTPLTDGSTYYIQIDSFCPSNAVAVDVEIDDPVDAGTPIPEEFCEDDLATNSPLDLFGQLTGEDTGGTWTDDNTTGALTGSDVDLTLLPIGTSVFTYNVLSNNACPDSSASVNITVYENFTSGEPSSINPASFCESQSPNSFDLFTLLDFEDLGGQWTAGTQSTDPVVNANIDLSSFTPNTYNFTYTQNLSPNPCPEESTTVQVIILPDPNAGVAVNATICENEIASNSPYDLFDLLDGSQDNNSGTWSDLDGNTVSNTIDISTFTVAGSSYQFTYTVSNGTCEDSETATITIEPAPESGNALTPFEVCFEDLAANSPFDLFTLLDGTQDNNGTWYQGSDTSGTSISNPVDISSLTAGTFDYTYDVPAIGACTDEPVTVQIVVFPQPNTGNPSAAIFCENDLEANSPLDLFSQLTGNDPGGNWTDDDATGTLTGSDVDLTDLTIGAYDFTYSITTTDGCSNSSTVTVTVLDAPDSGTVNPPAAFCVSEISPSQTFNLFDLLENEDQSGTWTDDNASDALSGNTVTLDGLATGTYDFTFDVAAIGSCDDVLVTVSIIINDTPAPAAATPQDFCDAATVADLLATGTNIQWYDDIIGGTPLVDSTALINGEDYYATQTDATTGCESSIRTQVDVNIYITPISGNAGSQIIACNDTTIDLNTALDGTQDAGGVWQDDDNTGAVTGNSFNTNGLTPGDYNFTYFIAGNAPCADASTSVTITIEQALNPGISTNTNLCSDSGTTDLFALLGTADSGGIWSPALTSGTGVFDPLTDTEGQYTYELMNSCGTFTSIVDVTVTQPADAGGDNTVTVCFIDEPFDLTNALSGTPDSNGTWSPVLASGTNIFDPAVDVSDSYTYTVLATSPCTTDASAMVDLTIDDIEAPTIVNATPSYCVSENPSVLDLDRAISAVGSVNWYSDAALTELLNVSEPLVDGEDYYATQISPSGCESSQNVTVVVTLNDSPTPSLIDASRTYCINDRPMISDLSLNIVENTSTDYDLFWYDALTGGDVISESTDLINGTTYYAVLVDAVTGCESSVRLEITPDLTSCGILEIPDGFSPNGDGTNDTFDMDNINIIYPNFEIEIFNRYGTVVYKGNANSPRFDGTSSQTNGNQILPVGVYFYIFNFNDGINKSKQGRLYINR